MSHQKRTDQNQVQSLFADLGRATRRGVRNCPKCGTLNGTRGSACKNKTCDVIFRDIGKIREIVTDPCKKLTLSDSDAFNVYSVRIRDKGPDYRNFVLLPAMGGNIRRVQQSDSLETIDILPQCYVETCLRNPNDQCRHIKAAQVCSSVAEVLVINHNILSSINIPSDTKHALSMMLNQAQDDFVQRCSKSTFAVKCETSSKHPLGFLHVLFFKGNREDGSAELKFFCGCRPVTNRRSNSRAFNPMACESQNKYCYHFYACICAFASCGPLISEFEFFVAQAISQTYSATLLSGLQLVPVLDDDEPNVEEMNPNHVMRENLSLLESITSDDTAHQQGQLLEGVLSDQIVVTNVGAADDALGFGDPSALEVLDETDPQISSHLTHISEILSHSSQSQQVVCQILRAPDTQYAGSLTSEFTPLDDSLYQGIRRKLLSQPAFKKFKDAFDGNTPASNSDSDVPTIVSVSSASGTTIMAENGGVGGTDRYHVLTKHHPIRPKNYSSNAKMSIQSAVQENDEMERHMIFVNFERWIAGVNERMNSAMHFEFGEPDPLVYFLPQEQFELFKDRIISGSRTKRLSSPTVSIALRDKPPTGAFSKHSWKITNIIHVIHIFQSTLVPLKLTQFFTRTSSGSYSEWIHPKPVCTRNEVAIPELHCSTLKVGKLEPGVKESTPFIIEWIPNILPESRMGELTLHFQVMRTGPIYTEEEIRACNSPIQRLIQQSHTFALR